MQTDKLQYLLPDYINGKLDAAMEATISQHIQEDASFRREYLRLKEVFGYLAEDKENSETPAAVSNLLVGINAAIDTREESFLVRVLRPRVLVPVAVALQIVTVFVLISVFNPQQDGIRLETGDLQAVLESAEHSELLALENNLATDVILPDLHISEEQYSVTSDIEDDFNEALYDEMFADVSYEEVLSAGKSYLSDEELLQSLHANTVAEVLQKVNDKSLL